MAQLAEHLEEILDVMEGSSRVKVKVKVKKPMVLVLLFAYIKKFSVSCMWDFLECDSYAGTYSLTV